MGASMGDHKAPDRREWSLWGGLSVGGVLGLTLGLTLVHWGSLGLVCQLSCSVMVPGALLVWDLLSQVCSPPCLLTNASTWLSSPPAPILLPFLLPPLPSSPPPYQNSHLCMQTSCLFQLFQ